MKHISKGLTQYIKTSSIQASEPLNEINLTPVGQHYKNTAMI